MNSVLSDIDGHQLFDALTSPSVKDAPPAELDLAFDQRVGVRRVASPSGRLRVQRDKRRIVAEWIIILGLAFSVAMLVRLLVVQTFSIPTVSMQPTLMVRDRLLVEKLSYGYRDIKRGEIIVFKAPDVFKETESSSENPENTVEDVVKRVVGLPGDTVEIRDGKVFVNAKQLDEPYLPDGTVTSQPQRIVVPIDEYFVMGDNRADSYDSRYWGTVPRNKVVGRVFYRVFPVPRVGSVR